MTLPGFSLRLLLVAVAVLWLTARQREWYCFNERQSAEAPDFDQAMGELLAEGKVERIIGRHYFRVVTGKGA